MKFQRHGKIYLAAVLLVFAALGILRADLIAGAFNMAAANLRSGGTTAMKTLAEMALLGGIAALTLYAVPLYSEPGRDCLIVATASLYGYLAESWGVNAGLWSYYTGEKPPLWIIPAWPLGALVIDRLSRKATEKNTALPFARQAARWLYPAWVITFYCVFTPFLALKLGVPASIPPLLLAALVLFPGTDRRQADAAVLFTGTACVFWADLWGVTNHCWAYYTQAAGAGTAAGIAFGALFDSLVVLAAIKSAGYLRRPAAGLIKEG